MNARSGSRPSDRPDDPIAAVVAEHLHEQDPPDLTAAVMQRVRDLPAHRPRMRPAMAAWQWLLEPRRITLPLRPAYGLVTAAAALVLLLVLPGAPVQDEVAALPGAPETVVYVQFRLEAPQAQTVQLAGTFTDWDPRHFLAEASPGVWTVTVPVRPGVHEYAFVVDGQEWRVDPHAPQVRDSFGGVNNRLPVLATPTGNS